MVILILNSKFKSNSNSYLTDLLGTIDYKIDDSEVVFRTCDEEKGRVILQIGTNCPDRALQAAKIV